MAYRSTINSRSPSNSRREKRPFTRTTGLTGTCVERPWLYARSASVGSHATLQMKLQRRFVAVLMEVGENLAPSVD